MDITADPSAFLAVVLNESARPTLLERSAGADLRSPPSLEWEIGNAFSAMVKRGRLTEEQVAAALRSFQQIPVQISPVALDSSVKIAVEHDIYAYDAYVLECCLRYGTPLLSLDARQCEVARALGIPVQEVA